MGFEPLELLSKIHRRLEHNAAAAGSSAVFQHRARICDGVGYRGLLLHCRRRRSFGSCRQAKRDVETVGFPLTVEFHVV
jgi:hypothetical protein